jgi:hypothetical protein
MSKYGNVQIPAIPGWPHARRRWHRAAPLPINLAYSHLQAVTLRAGGEGLGPHCWATLPGVSARVLIKGCGIRTRFTNRTLDSFCRPWANTQFRLVEPVKVYARSFLTVRRFCRDIYTALFGLSYLYHQSSRIRVRPNHAATACLRCYSQELSTRSPRVFSCNSSILHDEKQLPDTRKRAELTQPVFGSTFCCKQLPLDEVNPSKPSGDHMYHLL